MLLLSLQWLTVPCSPPLFSPSQSPKRSGGQQGGRAGQKGVLQHNQTPVSLVATQNLAVSTYPNCSIERVDEQSYHVWPPWGGGLLPEALQCSEKNKSQVQVSPKPPRASVKTSGFTNVWRAWVRREAGRLAMAVTLSRKVVSQWPPQGTTALIFIVSCLSLHSKLVRSIF